MGLMKKIMLCCALSLIMTSLCTCSNGKTEAIYSVDGDTVVMATVNLHDTLSYFLRDEEKCYISADLEISYPESYINNEYTERLQRLYAGSVLGVSADSATLATAFPRFMANLLARYSENDGEVSAEEMDAGYEQMSNCKLLVKIYPVYNAYGIVSFCREELSRIDDKLPETRRYYINIDLNKMTKIELSSIIAEDDYDRVTYLLKERLRDDADVVNDDELVELGYYNFENLTVGDNFYITADSITWNFLPRELSVLEEVQITLAKNEVVLK